MKQPEQWSSTAARIVATGERPHFAPEPETLAAHVRVLETLECALDRSNEQKVVGDWLEMPGIEAGSIDLVLGDASLNDAEYACMNSRRSRIQHTAYVESIQHDGFEPLGRCRIERAGPVSDPDFLTILWITERA